ncbi:SDR family oxidoreductase [Streptomyces sp. 3MP-14]|uniref:SDR family oxidoreductase n=1 Tax=Streptomyces mimosae TaxID=2586635 RepID=A0A5N6AP95_9ACTN|nr:MULTISPECIES: SDR family oxidoreductase [Streptomyces]KAB8169923.1 SDR family oxidoreductase [Streptomyces mimosae]KAB8178671.1 SDR family oxidoreductase [Streptomyces sp. 3MP-14]
MDLGLRDRVAVVTGGTGGIGEATVRAFAAEGARVVLTYRAAAGRAAELVDQLGGPERALAVRYDLADAESVEALVPAVEKHFGAVDTLVANAVRRPEQGPGADFATLDPAEWSAQLHHNLTATIRTVQTALPGMRTRGHGRIGLISSHLATKGEAGQEIYTAAKSALHGFALSLARAAGPDGVLVNVVSPGLTTTEGALGFLPPAVLAKAASAMPTGRLGSPEEVARAVVFYCSPANENITGELVSLTGRG